MSMKASKPQKLKIATVAIITETQTQRASLIPISSSTVAAGGGREGALGSTCAVAGAVRRVHIHYSCAAVTAVPADLEQAATDIKG